MELLRLMEVVLQMAANNGVSWSGGRGEWSTLSTLLLATLERAHSHKFYSLGMVHYLLLGTLRRTLLELTLRLPPLFVLLGRRLWE